MRMRGRAVGEGRKKVEAEVKVERGRGSGVLSYGLEIRNLE